MQLIWVTDPHLNFVNLDIWDAWLDSLRLMAGTHLLITGDITEADDIAWQLERLTRRLEMPIYFVLGNHDFYGSRIDKVREEMVRLCQGNDKLFYLTAGATLAMGYEWLLIGNDGWADGRFGDALASSVRLNDFKRIGNFGGCDLQADLLVMRSIADRCAAELAKQLESACRISNKILVATHVPPFREACLYDGKVTDDNWAPYFASCVMGELFISFAERYPTHLFHILCGHTHHISAVRMRPNLTIATGAAVYGRPEVQQVIDPAQLSNQVSLIS